MMDNLNQQTQVAQPPPPVQTPPVEQPLPQPTPPIQPVQPTQSTQPPPPTPPSRSFISKPLIILLIVVFLFAIFYAGTYFKLNKILTNITNPPKPTPSPTVPIPSPTPNPTANWKTYTNKKIGYSLKHPKNWILSESSESATFQPQKINEDEWEKLTEGLPIAQPKISIYLIPSPFSESLGKTGKLFIQQPRIISVGEKEAYYYESICAPKCSINVDLPYQDKTLQISFLSLEKQNEESIYKEHNVKVQNIDELTFDQILSTFKFLP